MSHSVDSTSFSQSYCFIKSSEKEAFIGELSNWKQGYPRFARLRSSAKIEGSLHIHYKRKAVTTQISIQNFDMGREGAGI